MKNKEFRIPVKKLIIIGPLCVISFIAFIIFQEMKWQRSVEATKKTKIHKTIITSRYGPLRGVIYYTKDSCVNSSSSLIGDIQNTRIWASGGPIIDFDNIPYRYRLGDLDVPYELSKQANNDTIVVHKDGYELKFLLPKKEPESPPEFGIPYLIYILKERRKRSE